MVKGIEFIKKFVKSNKQDRLIWELESPKKRKDIIWRFAGSNIFKTECLQEADYMSVDELETKLYQLNKSSIICFERER